MLVSRTSTALYLYANDTERTDARRAGMEGLRHKSRHSATCIAARLDRSAREGGAGQNICTLAQTIFPKFWAASGQRKPFARGSSPSLRFFSPNFPANTFGVFFPSL
jgi:hypothetical protein